VKRGLPESEKGKLLLVVGVFWSSTLAPDGRDSPLLKPMSYFRMRKRADHIAKTGLPELLEGVIERHLNVNPNVRLHLVGHSFGGRMIVGALRELSNRDRLAKLVQPAAFVNAVLLNAAIAPGDLHWLVENVVRVPGGRFSSASHSGLYNIHSLKDSANRYLFPLASMFSGDPVECAVGACGVPEFATLCLDESGRISTKRPNAESQPSQTDAMLAAWNVDATKVVFEHSDIYKGRVAHLVTELLFEDNRQTFAAVARPGPLPVAERCSADSVAREIQKNPSSGLRAD